MALKFRKLSLRKPLSGKRQFEHWKRRKRPTIPKVTALVPNMMTVLAICMGLTAIHFAFLQKWEHAVASILVAGVLDGMDGRLARFWGTSSAFGAELDTLADFINFGVAPALVLFFHSLSSLKGAGWALCLFFAVSSSLRLARFNTQLQSPMTAQGMFSVGVPAPGGALLALQPMIAEFVFERSLHVAWFAGMLLFSAIMMLSRYPTFVFKKLQLPTSALRWIVVASSLGMISLITAPWETLFMVVLLYIISLPYSGYIFKKQHIAAGLGAS